MVQEPYWTATARFADVVLPSTISLEREDVAGRRRARPVFAMQRALDPFGEASDDYAICARARRAAGRGGAVHRGEHLGSGCGTCTTGWRSSSQRSRRRLSFEAFWEAGELALPTVAGRRSPDRTVPRGAELRTADDAERRIEVFSETIERFGYWTGRATRPGWSPTSGIEGELARRFRRNWSRINRSSACTASSTSGSQPGNQGRRARRTADQPGRRPGARHRGRRAGEGPQRSGRRLAVARVTEAVRPGVVQMAAGAWYDPVALPGRGAARGLRGRPEHGDSRHRHVVAGASVPRGSCAWCRCRGSWGSRRRGTRYDPPPTAERVSARHRRSGGAVRSVSTVWIRTPCSIRAIRSKPSSLAGGPARLARPPGRRRRSASADSGGTRPGTPSADEMSLRPVRMQPITSTLTISL